MRVINYLFIFEIILSLFYKNVLINGQGSPSSCTYNGIDYSSLNNSTGYSATDQANQYTYYFNICNISKKCNNLGSGNVVACQVKNGGGAIQPVGLIGQGTFSTVNGNTLLNYKNTNVNQQCSGGVTRNMDIYLVPGNSFSISQVYEESKCQYGVTLTYTAIKPTPTPTPTPSSVTCTKINNGFGVEIQSYTNITCNCYGKSKCIDNNDGSACATNNLNGYIECTTNNQGTNSMTCYGSDIDCLSSGTTCTN